MSNKKSTAQGSAGAVVSFWCVSCIEKEHKVRVFSGEHKLDLTWADGMIGVIPVFENEKAAKKYASGNSVTFEVEVTGEN